MKLPVYIDYKSANCYFALEEIEALEKQYPIELDWYPINLDFASIYGVPLQRSNREQNKLKYIYWEARKVAEMKGYPMLPPRKIYNTDLVSVTGLFCKEKQKISEFNWVIYEKFFNRDIDLENQDELRQVISSLGLSEAEYAEFMRKDSQGWAAYNELQQKVESGDLFGIPTFIVDGQLYFGGNRLNWVREHLDQLFQQKVNLL